MPHKTSTVGAGYKGAEGTLYLLPEPRFAPGSAQIKGGPIPGSHAPWLGLQPKQFTTRGICGHFFGTVGGCSVWEKQQNLQRWSKQQQQRPKLLPGTEGAFPIRGFL